MPITMGSNIGSLQAQRRLADASDSLSSVYTRLSSGLRINKASDDAAGLAIASDLNSKGRVYTQAIRNGNDGVSLLAIADAAVESLSGIVTRIRELATQASNGAYSTNQRKALDAEAQALRAEYFRISNSASFNGQKLFDGSLGSGLRLQLGYGTNGSILAGVGGAIGTGSFEERGTYAAQSLGSSGGVTLADVNGDGIPDLLTLGTTSSISSVIVQFGVGDGTFGEATTYVNGLTATEGELLVRDINGDGILDLISAGSASSVGRVAIQLGLGDGTFGTAVSYTMDTSGSNALAIGDLNGDGILDLVTSGISGGSGSMTIRYGTGAGSFGAAQSFAAESLSSNGVVLSDLDGDGQLEIITAGRGVSGELTIFNFKNGAFQESSSFTSESIQSRAIAARDINGDGIIDLVSAGSGVGGFATVFLGRGDGTFSTGVSYSMDATSSSDVELVDLNGDGILDLITAGTGGGTGRTTVRIGRGDGTFGEATSFNNGGLAPNASVAIGDINQDGVPDIVAYSSAQLVSRVATTIDGISPLQEFSLLTLADARQAQGLFDIALNNLAKQRGVISSFQSRLAVAISTLDSSRENFAAAGARIRDADIASESAKLVRLQFLQQAGTAVLAQANQQPALAIQLLTG